jgi:dTDP-4-amino-4,6-dideoxygalactose transaminase
VVTGDDALAETVRMLRFHGSRDKVTFEAIGVNSRLDELQAGVLRVQLPHLDTWSDGRRAAAAHYEAAGLGELVRLPVPAPGSQPAWHLYVIRSPQADELAEAFAAAGIGARAYYRLPVHRQPAMREWGAAADLPVTDELAATHLAIPMSPVLTAEQAAEVTGVAQTVIR